MLNQNKTTQDPEKVEKENELKNLTDAITVAKNELTQVCDDKKRVTQEIADLKTEHENGLRKSEAESQQKLTQITLDVEEKIKERIDLEKEVEDLTKQKTVLEIENAPLVEENKKQNDLLKTVKGQVQETLKIKTTLGDDVTGLRTEIATLTTTKSNLETDISVHSTTKSSLEDKITTHNTTLNGVKEATKTTENLKSTLEKEVENLTGLITSKTEELANIQNPLADLKKEVSDLQSTKDGILKEISDKKLTLEQETEEKTSALQILEKRVDEKLDIFKQYKSKFSADQLETIKKQTGLE